MPASDLLTKLDCLCKSVSCEVIYKLVENDWPQASGESVDMIVTSCQMVNLWTWLCYLMPSDQSVDVIVLPCVRWSVCGRDCVNLISSGQSVDMIVLPCVNWSICGCDCVTSCQVVNLWMWLCYLVSSGESVDVIVLPCVKWWVCGCDCVNLISSGQSMDVIVLTSFEVVNLWTWLC